MVRVSERLRPDSAFYKRVRMVCGDVVFVAVSSCKKETENYWSQGSDAMLQGFFVTCCFIILLESVIKQY